MTEQGGQQHWQSFDTLPLASAELAGQTPDRLTDNERAEIEAYALGGFELVNAAMRGLTPMTPSIERRIIAIRSGLRRYPLPTAVRVTRETEADLYGIVDAASALALIDQEFVEDAFLSTSGVDVPPRSLRHRHPVILELVVPAGTPALRLGELAEVREEREVLVIDARRYFIMDVYFDQTRSMWRIQATVMEEPQ
ncbi:ADP-ribosyltransferase [Nocardia cyriacigeorgica]|uniref:ADP-ribosyltransferase n=1 Tax=Nocardia cyriacigeorgica TaxID=135487 RepID=UPI00148742A6|nr:ADP-ribosyltransferase [Nocardia cyriacigeorgica]